MTLNETLKHLKALGNEATWKHNAKWGAGDNHFGVKHGDIRALAKKMGSDPALAMSLWKTGNVDAQFLATLLINLLGNVAACALLDSPHLTGLTSLSSPRGISVLLLRRS